MLDRLFVYLWKIELRYRENWHLELAYEVTFRLWLSFMKGIRVDLLGSVVNKYLYFLIELLQESDT